VSDLFSSLSIFRRSDDADLPCSVLAILRSLPSLSQQGMGMNPMMRPQMMKCVPPLLFAYPATCFDPSVMFELKLTTVHDFLLPSAPEWATSHLPTTR
jgi:hypothetical protein